MAGSPASSVRGGFPLGLAGAVAATRYVGGTASGAPVAGTFAVGDFVIEQTGKVYVCTVAGTPGTWVQAGGSGGGGEVGYDQITSAVLVTGTAVATPTTVITCAAHTFTAVPHILTVSAPQLYLGSGASNSMVISVWEGATQLAVLGDYGVVGPGSVFVTAFCANWRFTPTAASHTYLIRAYVSNTTGNPEFSAGNGGTGATSYVPAFARFVIA